MTTNPIEDNDDGLAPERTAMAWNRSGIAFLVAIGALARRVWPIDRGNHQIVVVALGLAALTFVVSLFLASRLATHARYRGATMDVHAFRLVSIGTVVLAIAGFALALFPA